MSGRVQEVARNLCKEPVATTPAPAGFKVRQPTRGADLWPMPLPPPVLRPGNLCKSGNLAAVLTLWPMPLLPPVLRSGNLPAAKAHALAHVAGA